MAIMFSTFETLFALFILLSGLGLVVGLDPYFKRTYQKVMFMIVALALVLVVQNIWENELFIRHSNLPLKNALSAFGYSIRPVFLVLFLYLTAPEERKWPLWLLAGINGVLYGTSPFTKLCFGIREADYASLRGPLWFTCPVISAILLAVLLAQAIIKFRDKRKWEQAIPSFTALIIILSVALDYKVGMENQPVSFLTIAIVAGSIFYYIWLHLQFVREHERDLVAAQRVQIMMTQIQPHFLFNALNTVRALYKKDPPLADRTLEDFSAYLRQNLESLNQPDLIPVVRELEHTRLYAGIEALRFPDIRVEYKVEDEGFKIPALTIQPLVENAIRHGVRSRKGGRVTISTVQKEGYHQIKVRDNGAGFDLSSLESAKETHIGIRNVKDRVEKMCGGSMILQSETGKGTCVTLLIPENIRSNVNEGNLCRR